MANICCAQMLQERVFWPQVIRFMLTAARDVFLSFFLFVFLPLSILQMRRLKCRRLNKLGEGTLLVYPQAGV